MLRLHSSGTPGFPFHQPQWEAFAGSSLFPVEPSSNFTRPRSMSTAGPFGKILDPRSGLVQRWNHVLLVARGIALAVDPMFFYTLTLMVTDGGPPCVSLDGGLAAIVSVVRICVNAVHLWHLWLQFRLAYVSKESLVISCGKLVWDAQAIASHYVRSFKGFWFDLFVILPAPQVYHSLCLMRRMRKVIGNIFGSIWWCFGLNLIASHVAEGCWYIHARNNNAKEVLVEIYLPLA